MEENKENTEPTTSDDDVEGHSLGQRPPAERPPAEANSEPDVEGHVLSERPPAE